MQAFKAGNYGTAFAKFDESYGLVPAATTAALACQAKVNADRDHPSAAMVWLSRWQASAAKRPPDEKGWAALQRAYEALGQITGDLEGQIEKLKKEKQSFEAMYAAFNSQVKVLNIEINSTKHLLPDADQGRLAAQLKAIDATSSVVVPASM